MMQISKGAPRPTSTTTKTGGRAAKATTSTTSGIRLKLSLTAGSVTDISGRPGPTSTLSPAPSAAASFVTAAEGSSSRSSTSKDTTTVPVVVPGVIGAPGALQLDVPAPHDSDDDDEPLRLSADVEAEDDDDDDDDDDDLRETGFSVDSEIPLGLSLEARRRWTRNFAQRDREEEAARLAHEAEVAQAAADDVALQAIVNAEVIAALAPAGTAPAPPGDDNNSASTVTTGQQLTPTASLTSLTTSLSPSLDALAAAAGMQSPVPATGTMAAALIPVVTTPPPPLALASPSATTAATADPGDNANLPADVFAAGNVGRTESTDTSARRSLDVNPATTDPARKPAPGDRDYVE